MDRADDALRGAKTIGLNRSAFEKVARSNGWTTDAEIAKALGMSERQVSRIRSGKGRPGIDFIAGLLDAAEEVDFHRVFCVVPKTDPIERSDR